jgi:hypothetical protein
MKAGRAGNRDGSGLQKPDFGFPLDYRSRPV